MIGRAAACDGAQRRFPGDHEGFSGNLRALEWPKIDDRTLPRGTGRVETGRSAGGVAGSKEWPVGLFALAVREAGDQEVEELARDGPATAVTGGARERLHGRPPSWLEPR